MLWKQRWGPYDIAGVTSAMSASCLPDSVLRRIFNSPASHFHSPNRPTISDPRHCCVLNYSFIMYISSSSKDYPFRSSAFQITQRPLRYWPILSLPCKQFTLTMLTCVLHVVPRVLYLFYQPSEFVATTSCIQLGWSWISHQIWVRRMDFDQRQLLRTLSTSIGTTINCTSMSIGPPFFLSRIWCTLLLQNSRLKTGSLLPLSTPFQSPSLLIWISICAIEI